MSTLKTRNWSPLGDRIRGLPLRSFPSDGLFVRLPGSLVVDFLVGALHLIHVLTNGETSYKNPSKRIKTTFGVEEILRHPLSECHCHFEEDGN